MTGKTLACLAAAALAAACSTTPSPIVAPTTAAEVGKFRGDYLKGYLAPAELPDSLALLPPPPAADSAAQAADLAAFKALTALQATPRGALAVQDADLSFPAVAATFSCALGGVSISEAATPHLNMLLRRTLTDTGLATYRAKDKYVRTRPFVSEKAQSCTPKEEAHLAKDGSYPSGHSAVGWGWALLLAELAPERAGAVLQRGRAFAQSRAVCGVHWQSDVEAGRLMGAAVVARLHANPVFNAQMAAAREELNKARAAARTPAPSCTAEAQAIASTSQLAP